MRHIELAGLTLRGAVAGFGVTLLIILSGLGVAGVPWRDMPLLGSVIAAGFALVVLVFVLSWSVWRLRASVPSPGSSVLLGVASASVAIVVLVYVFEGLEEGLLSLLVDPVFWIWFVGFALGGAALGWLCREERGALSRARRNLV